MKTGPVIWITLCIFVSIGLCFYGMTAAAANGDNVMANLFGGTTIILIIVAVVWGMCLITGDFKEESKQETDHKNIEYVSYENRYWLLKKTIYDNVIPVKKKTVNEKLAEHKEKLNRRKKG